MAAPTIVDEDVGETSAVIEQGPTRWRLAPHLVALLVLQILLIASSGRENSWTPDDGAYALQVRTLETTGAWEFPYPHTDIDPDLEHLPFTHGTVTDHGVAFPYTKWPAWILVLRASSAVFGDVVGLALPSAFGVVAAAAVAGRLARRFDPTVEVWAAWAVGLGGVLVSGTAFWAHTTAAALAALSIGPVIDVASGRWRRATGLLLGFALGAACLLRTEALLYAAATLTVLAFVVAVWPRSLIHRARALAWLVVLPGSVVGLARAASAAASDAITRGAAVVPSSYTTGSSAGLGGGLIDKWNAMRRTLIDGLGMSPEGNAIAVVGVIAFVAAGVAFSRHRPRAAAAAVVVGLVSSGVRTLVVAPGDLGGLLTATPLLVLVAPTVARSVHGRGARAVGAVLGLFTAAVLVTQYPEGGSRDWGGRFLLPLVVPVTVAGVVAVRRNLFRFGADDRRLLGVALIATVFVPSLFGLHATQLLREVSGSLTDRAVASDADVVVRTSVYSSRLSWKAIPDGDWLAAHPDQADRLVADLSAAGTGSIAVVGHFAPEASTPPGWERTLLARDVVLFEPG